MIPTSATFKLGEPDLFLLPNFRREAMKNSNLIIKRSEKTIIICKNTYFFFFSGIFSFILLTNFINFAP